MKIKWRTLMEMEIVTLIAGPFAGARAAGRNAKASARWDALFGGGCDVDYNRAEAIIADMRAMTKRGSLRKFEDRTYDIVKRFWPAIDALGDELMKRESLVYDDAAAVVLPLLTSIERRVAL